MNYSKTLMEGSKTVKHLELNWCNTNSNCCIILSILHVLGSTSISINLKQWKCCSLCHMSSNKCGLSLRWLSVLLTGSLMKVSLGESFTWSLARKNPGMGGASRSDFHWPELINLKQDQTLIWDPQCCYMKLKSLWTWWGKMDLLYKSNNDDLLRDYEAHKG